MKLYLQKLLVLLMHGLHAINNCNYIFTKNYSVVIRTGLNVYCLYSHTNFIQQYVFTIKSNRVEGFKGILGNSLPICTSSKLIEERPTNSIGYFAIDNYVHKKKAVLLRQPFGNILKITLQMLFYLFSPSILLSFFLFLQEQHFCIFLLRHLFYRLCQLLRLLHLFQFDGNL